MTKTTKMTLSRAVEISHAVCVRAFLTEGVTDDPVLPVLAGVSLPEMVAAVTMVREKTTFVVPDDRLVAAVYVAVNYSVGEVPVVVEPEQLSDGVWIVKAVAVVDVTQRFRLVDGKSVAA
jgi:hypothetical protein